MDQGNQEAHRDKRSKGGQGIKGDQRDKGALSPVTPFEAPSETAKVPLAPKVPTHRYLNDPKVLQAFGWGDRFLEGVYEGMHPKHGAHFGTVLTNMDSDPLGLEPRDLPQTLSDLRFTLKVGETSSLRVDHKVRDPFLTVHAVDLSTGQVLDVVSEGFGIEDFGRPSGQRNPEILKDPQLFLSTTECSLVSGRKTSASWNEILSFRIRTPGLFRTSLLLLFEVQNFRSVWTPQKTRVQRLHKLCWGYLRPFTADLSLTGPFQIRLFEYQMDQEKAPRDLAPGVPLVYFDFLWHVKKRYEAGFLTVELGAGPPSPASSNSLQEAGDRDSKRSYQALSSQGSLDAPKTEDEIQRERFLESIRFKSDEGYKMPDTLSIRLPTAALGCSALRFSPDGRFLAFACTDGVSLTRIRVFDFEIQRPHCVLFGHSGLVHRIAWSGCGRFLATASSDGSAAVFKIPKTQKMDLSGSVARMLKYRRVQLSHPSFVYDVGFVLEDEGAHSGDLQSRVVATCCADGATRLFRVDPKARKADEVVSIHLPQPSFPNCFASVGRKLFVGSSHGRVHQYLIEGQAQAQGQGQVQGQGHGQGEEKLRLTEGATIERPEISNDVINEVRAIEDGELLVVQTRDNCLRLLETESGNILNRYFGGKVRTHNIRGFVSPDTRLLFSGCESGETRAWDFVSAQTVLTGFDYRIAGAVYTGDCNPRYNVLAVCGFGGSYPLAIYHAKPFQ